ncbi:amidase [Fusarium heterosporum]|uniref:Amidase n=1 Tax=Fusarium heterosporum TaxID=42747 RepID=A0A8H5TLF6_FUSHE|nr:amidase [Fusarium heterosporum]
MPIKEYACRHKQIRAEEWGETDNPLWGLTTHPLNPDFTPGGSTGGEGTLLSLNGSAIGWGTDTGGPIRIPAHMNGLWGFKPSVSNSFYLSSDCVQSIDKTQSGGSLERVFKDLSQKLEAAGHELVPWDISSVAECADLMTEYYFVDGGEDIRRDIAAAGEQFLPHVQSLVESASAISVYEYWQLNKRKKAKQAAYNKMWNIMRSPSGRPVDVLLVPTMPHTAIPHRTMRYTSYTKLFNFLDYTALSFPAGKASKAFDPSSQEHQPRNETDAWNWGLYDIEKMDGFSIGLQIVGRRMEEEKGEQLTLNLQRGNLFSAALDDIGAVAALNILCRAASPRARLALTRAWNCSTDGNVTSLEPPIARELLLSGGGVAPVFGENSWSTDLDLALSFLARHRVPMMVSSPVSSFFSTRRASTEGRGQPTELSSNGPGVTPKALPEQQKRFNEYLTNLGISLDSSSAKKLEALRSLPYQKLIEA